MAAEQAQPGNSDREHTNQGDIVLRLSHARSRLASFRAVSPQQTSPGTPNLWNGDLATLEDYLLSSQSGSHRGLGTFLGVFVPCTATTFGVVVFMRLGFVVGHAGVWLALLFVFGAFLLCLLTTLSLCALISTDGCPDSPETAGTTDGPRGTRLETAGTATGVDPGVYSALRKRVGPELGAALGTAFFAAFTADVAFYITGFSEAFCAAFGVGSHGRADDADATQVFPWNAPGTWVETAVSSGVLLLLALVCARGVEFSAQVSALSLAAILGILLLALVCLLVPTADAQSGLTQFSAETFANNSWPAMSLSGGASEGFSATLLFALTFPGFTGFLAGSNLSADLRTPTRSIVRLATPAASITPAAPVAPAARLHTRLQVRGTLGSLGFVFVVYAALVLTLAASVRRDVLQTNLNVLSTVVEGSVHAPLGYAGVACATLSSALSYLLGAPRVLQAVARDAGWARLRPLAARPLRALALTWAAVQLILLTGTVDLLAPAVSGVFLLAFVLINLVCFVASVSKADFAPSFRLYSNWSALAGTVLSLAAMLGALSTSTALCGALSVLLLLLLLWCRRPLVQLLTEGRWSFGPGGPAAAPRGRGLTLDAAGHPEADGALEDRLLRAKAYVHDAMQSRFRGEHWTVGDASRPRAMYTLKRLSWLRVLNLGVYMGLSFFEQPSWCYGQEGCPLHPQTALTFGLPVLPVWGSQLVESVCVFGFLVEMRLKVGHMSSRLFFASPWHVIQLGILALNAAGIVTSLLSPATAPFLNPMLRPLLFVAMSRSVRRSFGSFLLVLPAVSDALLLVLLLLGFFAATGVLLFSAERAGSPFETVPRALINLFVLLTAANFPDVMLPAYQENRLAALFFVAFLILGLFLLTNLILAAVFRKYKSELLAGAERARGEREQAMAAAFRLLDLNSNGFVTLQDFSLLLQSVQRPVFSLLSGEASSAFDVALTQAKLQRMLCADAAMPVRGLGVEAFTECLLALQEAPKPRASVFGDDNDSDDDSGGGGGGGGGGDSGGGGDGSGTSPCSCCGSTSGHSVAPLVAAGVGGGGGGGSGSGGGSGGNGRADVESGEGRRGSGVCSSGSSWPQASPAEGAQGESRQRAGLETPRNCLARLAAIWSRRRRLRQRVRRGLRSVWAERLVDTVIIADAAVLLFEVQLLAQRHADAGDAAYLQALESPGWKVFDTLYAGELGLKLWCFGTLPYRRTVQYAYAGATTVLSAGADLSLAAAHDFGQPSEQMQRAVYCLRALRMLRLLASVERFNAIYRHFVRLLPAFSALFGALWALFYVYAQLGIVIFGGRIRTDVAGQPNVAYALNNFNDFGSALVTLFELLVVNNWNVIMDQAVAVSNDWARIYFVSWFILAVMVMSNLIVAHILDGILIEEETPPAPESHEEAEAPASPTVSLRASTASVSQPRNLD